MREYPRFGIEPMFSPSRTSPTARKVQGSGLRVTVLKVKGLGFKVSGLRFRA